MNRCCWLWVALLHFGWFWFILSLCERFKCLFFTAMKIHTMARIIKKQNNFVFSCTSYINLLDVFHLYCRAWNNHTGTTIYIELKSFLYDTYMRLCDYQFYLLIPPARLFHSAQSFSFELRRNTIRILC